jgi:hypothetical protein
VLPHSVLRYSHLKICIFRGRRANQTAPTVDIFHCNSKMRRSRWGFNGDSVHSCHWIGSIVCDTICVQLYLEHLTFLWSNFIYSISLSCVPTLFRESHLLLECIFGTWNVSDVFWNATIHVPVKRIIGMYLV